MYNAKFYVTVAIGSVLLIALALVTAYIGGNNTGNRLEQGIRASHEQSRNVLGQYAPQLKEALGVTKIQAKAVEDIITGANASRYGEDGSKASMQWIREQNPNLDQSNYGKIIALIEAGRNDFKTAQQDKIDRLRAYETAIGNIPGGFFIKMAGYPTPGFIEKYSVIVVSGHANDAFASGVDNGVALN